MNLSLALGSLALQPVGVGIAAKKRCLEEEHASVPHAGGAAEPRKNGLADNGLDLEKKKCGNEDSDCEKKHLFPTRHRPEDGFGLIRC